MSQVLPFREVLEAADHLSPDEQEQLIAILNRRLAQAARQRLAAEIQEARQEFAEGHCVPLTPILAEELYSNGADVADVWGPVDTIYRRLASSGQTFSDSGDLLREDRDR